MELIRIFIYMMKSLKKHIEQKEFVLPIANENNQTVID